MRNFHFLFAAWMAAWSVFFVYELSIASRMGRLREEIERLKQQLRERRAV
jgi:CcmD family protein